MNSSGDCCSRFYQRQSHRHQLSTITNATGQGATDLEVTISAPTTGKKAGDFASFSFSSVTAFLPNFQDLRYYNGTVANGATERIGVSLSVDGKETGFAAQVPEPKSWVFLAMDYPY